MNTGDLVAGKYRLQRQLGSGSMGSVWAARNELTNRDFAVKFLQPELTRNTEAVQRFFHEARACGQIRHPAIVDVFDVGHAEDGSPFLVMELLEGEGLDQRIAKQHKLRPADVCRWIAIVSRGLDEAHARGLIHRDLKPGNIFFAIDKNAEVLPKVLDFGISKEIQPENFELIQTHRGTVLGSPAYMSPEQARGDLVIDARTDVWSLGAIMYEALTGRLPFHASNYNALMMAIITTPHTPVAEAAAEVPPALAALVDEALAKDRDERVPSAARLADRLERIYATLTQTPFELPERATTSSLSLSRSLPVRSTQGGWSDMRPLVGGRRWATPVVVGAVLLVTAGAGYAWYRLTPTPTVPPIGRLAPSLSKLVDGAAVAFDRTLAASRPASAPPDLPPPPPGEEPFPRAGAGRRAETAETRSSDPPASPSAQATGSTPPAEPTDPHGGVDSAGF